MEPSYEASSNSFSSSKQLFMGQSKSLPKFARNIHEEIIKNNLSQILEKQITVKNLIKKDQKSSQLSLQKQLVKDVNFLHRIQQQRDKQFMESYKNQANWNVKLKQLKKQYEHQTYVAQKNQIGQLYKQNQKTIQTMIMGANFQDYMGSNNQYLNSSSNSKFLHSENQQNQAGQLNQRQNLNPQQGFLQKSTHYKMSTERVKQEKARLRQTLLEQMRIKDEQKKQQKMRLINTHFVNQPFKKTISNTQTGGKIPVKPAGLSYSYLSRRGSGSLLNYGY